MLLSYLHFYESHYHRRLSICFSATITNAIQLPHTFMGKFLMGKSSSYIHGNSVQWTEFLFMLHWKFLHWSSKKIRKEVKPHESLNIYPVNAVVKLVALYLDVSIHDVPTCFQCRNIWCTDTTTTRPLDSLEENGKKIYFKSNCTCKISKKNMPFVSRIS